MTVVEKIRQLLALAASTTFAGERDSALTKARLLFNKHRVADARLRWELLTALGKDAGPEPSRPEAATATAETETETEPGTAWWEQAEAAEAEWFARWQRRRQAAWAEEQKREREAERARRRTQTRTQQRGGGRRQKRRVRVRRHWSRRTFVPIEDYTRTIVSRRVPFRSPLFHAPPCGAVSVTGPPLAGLGGGGRRRSRGCGGGRGGIVEQAVQTREAFHGGEERTQVVGVALLPAVWGVLSMYVQQPLDHQAPAVALDAAHRLAHAHGNGCVAGKRVARAPPVAAELRDEDQLGLAHAQPRVVHVDERGEGRVAAGEERRAVARGERGRGSGSWGCRLFLASLGIRLTPGAGIVMLTHVSTPSIRAKG